MSAADEVRAAALRRDMGRRFELCNLDELRVIDLQLVRLELGREQYGHLDLARPRDWAKEEAEEYVDAAFYRSCAVLVARDGSCNFTGAESKEGADGPHVDR